MNELHYTGFDVHKKSVSYCVKTASGEILQEGELAARREALRAWAAAQPQPWRGSKSGRDRKKDRWRAWKRRSVN